MIVSHLQGEGRAGLSDWLYWLYWLSLGCRLRCAGSERRGRRHVSSHGRADWSLRRHVVRSVRNSRPVASGLIIVIIGVVSIGVVVVVIPDWAVQICVVVVVVVVVWNRGHALSLRCLGRLAGKSSNSIVSIEALVSIGARTRYATRDVRGKANVSSVFAIT